MFLLASAFCFASNLAACWALSLGTGRGSIVPSVSRLAKMPLENAWLVSGARRSIKSCKPPTVHGYCFNSDVAWEKIAA